MCRWGMPALPELPQRPMTSPRRTRAPGASVTESAARWRNSVYSPGACSMIDVVAGVAALAVGGPVARVAVRAHDGAVGGRQHRPAVTGERGQRRARGAGAGVAFGCAGTKSSANAA